MSDDLLRYYNSELQYVRRLGDQFARAHPQVAPNLRFGTDGDYDPYVGRLVEAFAYLNARTRQKIEDEFPEIAASYLDIILPHYQRPVPSSCIARFELDSSLAEQFDGYPIARHATVESAPVNGEACLFRTCYPVTCWPFRIAGVSLRGLPFDAPAYALPEQPLGMLQISLETLVNKLTFDRFSASRLRFYIRLAPPFSFQLHELLLDGVLGVAVADSAKEGEATRLPPEAVRAVGFELDEGLVDYPPQSFPGYRLLAEYFAFPEKFLFVDIELGEALRKVKSPRLEIFCYLRKRWKDLEPQVKKDVLQTGCSPLVNLFPKRAEPIRVTHFEAQYTIVPDARRPLAHEIWSVDSVHGIAATGEEQAYVPFYSFRHTEGRAPRAFWHSTRRFVPADNELAAGTEIDIAFVDLDFNPLAGGRWTIDIETTCTNRNLPPRLPFGGQQSWFQLSGGGAVTVEGLTRPTAPLRPPVGPELRWRVVSHLALNHLSLVDDAQGATALRELLQLYDFRNDEITGSSVAGLLKVTGKPMLGRVPGDRYGALGRGTEITLEFDEEKYTAGNLFLFASVLDRFLALYSNLNSFTRTVVTSNRRQGTLYKWPPRSGTRNLI